MNLKSVIKSGAGAASIAAAFAVSHGAYAQSYNVNVTPVTQTVSGTNGGTTTVTVVGSNSTANGIPSQPALASLTISGAGTFTNFSNVPFTLSISVTNATTGQTSAAQNEVVTFANGSQATGDNNSSLFSGASFSGPLTFTFASSSPVNLNSFTFSAPNASGGNGQVAATLTSGAAAPEPGALALAIPGLLGVVGLVRRRKSA